MGFLIDTCIWIDVERGAITPNDVYNYTGNEPVYISPITIAELTYGVENSKREDIKQQRIAALNKLRKKPSLIIDLDTGDIFGKLSFQLFKTGRSAGFRVQDLWIASQAIQNDLKLLTKNRKDFEDIPGLQLVIYK